MSEMDFQNSFIDAMVRIDPDVFIVEDDDSEAYVSLYKFVEQYALEKHLLNTSIALPLVRGVISRVSSELPDEFKGASEYASDFTHCLSVTKMLISLHVPLSQTEEDILLASSICHILPENIPYQASENQLTQKYCLDPAVHKIIMLLYRRDGLSEGEQKRYFKRIQSNRLALLIALADRGNLMGHLYEISSWSARKYIHETRSHFFPMSVYAKEHYQDLLPVINVLTEKMKSLIEIEEILLSRYEAQETELIQEIISLKEENARLKGLIQKHQDG